MNKVIISTFSFRNNLKKNLNKFVFMLALDVPTFLEGVTSPTNEHNRRKTVFCLFSQNLLPVNCYHFSSHRFNCDEVSES
jgi:hypothetical protein